MNRVEDQLCVIGRGIHIHGTTASDVVQAQQNFFDRLSELGISEHVHSVAGPSSKNPMIEFRLKDRSANELAPGCDTTEICKKLNLNTQSNPCDLEREILLAMLAGPIPFQLPSFDELVSCVRIRKGIVEAARKTSVRLLGGSRRSRVCCLAR